MHANAKIKNTRKNVVGGGGVDVWVGGCVGGWMCVWVDVWVGGCESHVIHIIMQY